ncbi:DUF7661 family protein [Hafnia alvei]
MMATKWRQRFCASAIPDFIAEDEIPQWLDDIYHEAATMEHPDVYRVE